MKQYEEQINKIYIELMHYNDCKRHARLWVDLQYYWPELSGPIKELGRIQRECSSAVADSVIKGQDQQLLVE